MTYILYNFLKIDNKIIFIQNLVSHLLTKNPEKRYNSVEFFNDPWVAGEMFAENGVANQDLGREFINKLAESFNLKKRQTKKMNILSVSEKTV